MRGRDDPDIDTDGVIRTEPLDFACLQHPKQLDLDFFGQLAHLVQEDRAPVRELESAGPPSDCSGEGAALVPEQFSLDEGRRQCPAVHDDEGLVAAATLPVHGARDELLAGAGFARHQHCGVGGSNLRDLIQQPRECGRPTDDVLGVAVVLFLAIAVRFASQTRFQPCDLFQCVPESVFIRSARRIAGEGHSGGLGGPADLTVRRQVPSGRTADVNSEHEIDTADSFCSSDRRCSTELIPCPRAPGSAR